jgi:hypothetical protein
MRIAAGSAVLMAGLVVGFGTAGRASAQKEKTAGKDDKTAAKADPATPKFLYGHDLRVRPGGKSDWIDAHKFGIEVFEDSTTKAFVGISEAGALAAVPAGAVGEKRTCQWLTAQDLSARKAGELEFTTKTKKYGVEVFKDLGSNRLLYVCETASIAFADIPSGLVTDRGPKWHHGLEPKVRAPEQQSFDNAKKYGVEVFKDENTGGLIYITETGSIATATAPSVQPDKAKIAPPKTEYGLILRVRGADETDFTDKTKKFGVEVFSDPNANNQLIYMTEAGSIAVAPNPGKFDEKGGVTWKHAMALKARKGGEKGFENAKKYGIEVFEDNRTGHLLFISETGAIAVVPKR